MSNLATQAETGNVTTLVLGQVKRLTEAQSLVLPADYSVENALKSAWFWIQNSEQKDKLLACTRESQTNALFDMILQCGDVARKTGYFIPYGQRMIYQRSYFGEEALAKRVRPGIEVYGDVVYKGEAIKVVKARNKYGLITQVKEHEQAFPRTSKEIVACYVGVMDENGEDMGVEIMDIDQIRTSWKKSKQYGPNSQTFHNEQPDIACKRTVLRRRLKVIINTSTDEWLLQALARQDLDETAAEMDEEIEQKANKNLITMPPVAVDPAKSVQTAGDQEDAATDEQDEETETPPAEAPAQTAAAPEPQATQHTQESAPPAKTGVQRLELVKAENDECKALYESKGQAQSYVLYKAAAEKDGCTTYEAFKARIEAIGAVDPGY